MTAATNALGRELQLVHAAQWLYAINAEPFVPGEGDPYARLVRGFESGENGTDDAGGTLASIAERGPVWRSRLDTWVVTGPAALRELSAGAEPAVSAAVPQAEAWLPDPERQRTTGLARDLARRGGTRAVGRLAGSLREQAGQAAARLGPGPVDLVADFAEPLTAAGYAAVLDVPEERRAAFAADLAAAAPAVDALLCPQTLDTTRRLAAGVRGLRELFAGRAQAEADLLLAVAGARAAADLLGDALRRLLDRPREWALLRSDPAHAARLVEEVLHQRPPWRACPLVALATAEVAGTRIEAGDSLTAITTAAAVPGGPSGIAGPTGTAAADGASRTAGGTVPPGTAGISRTAGATVPAGAAGAAGTGAAGGVGTAETTHTGRVAGTGGAGEPGAVTVLGEATRTNGVPTPLPVAACATLLPAARALAEHALVALAARFPLLRPDGEPVRTRRAPLTRRLVRLPARLGEEETR
ncbi:hypothetical protein [Streptomyces purpurascens]|uniref:hypothetical protein n=1 Tax=Streptomyces purpurascens TaxID=1924 RepID=UPI0019849470|nr:hypothetical protein [Streptomyces purpurascens]GHA30521.1 hypothetical protein GCM10010303_46700 [Streptomyces purpurascens]